MRVCSSRHLLRCTIGSGGLAFDDASGDDLAAVVERRHRQRRLRRSPSIW